MQITVSYSKYLSSISPSIQHDGGRKESIAFHFSDYANGRYSTPVCEYTRFDIHATGAFRKIINRHVENYVHEAAIHKGAESKKDYEISSWAIQRAQDESPTLTWSIRFWKDAEGSVHRVEGFTKLSAEQMRPIRDVLNTLIEPITKTGITVKESTHD